ncbi:MAG: non-ribosomal peptide synthetase, partial [Opitutaceae bacterium]
AGTRDACAPRTDSSARPIPLSLQYADYAAWQRRTVASGAFDSHREYWRRQMEGACLSIELPFDRRRPEPPTNRGGRGEFFLEPALVENLERFGASHQATPFMAWLAVFATYLSRISGQRDLVIGTPLAGRDRPEVQPLIGFFLNTLPLRVRIDEPADFRALLGGVRTSVLEGFEHGELPLDEIIPAGSTVRRGAGSSLFPVMFVLHDDAPASWNLSGTKAEPLRSSMGTAKADLTLFLGRMDDGRLRGSFEFSTDVFETATIDRAMAQFVRLVRSITRAPDAAIHTLDILPDGERRQVLHAFNDTEKPYARDATVHALFEEHARLSPDAVALALRKQRVTYADLNRRANHLARRLCDTGVESGARVAVLLDRSIEFVVSVLAILKAGAAYVPIGTDFPAERVRFILQDAAVRAVITQGEFSAKLKADGFNVLDPADDADPARGASDDLDISTVHGNTHGTCAATSPAYVIYTSGSTGRPKGVVVPHRGIVRLVRGQTYASFDAGTRLMLMASVAFDASTFELWGALLNGGTCMIFPDRWPEPDSLEAAWREHGVSCVFLTSGLFNQIADERPAALATVGHVLTGGEVMSSPHRRRALEAVPSLRLTHVYGPTECTTFATAFEIPREPAACREPEPIGGPVAHTRACILDPHGNPSPIGVRGELCLGGDGVALGYLNRPELTAERFVPDPCSGEAGARLYRTGDQARWLADGTIEFLGRLDGQIKLRGFRIELGEIESVLSQHPDFAQAAVALREVNGNKELHAHLVARDGATLSGSEIRNWLSARLPDYMVPARYALLERLPLNANGKVDRQALPGIDHGEPACAEEHAAPRTPAEVALAAIWERVLGRERIGIRDNFFDAGGTSLLAMRLVHEIRREFNRPLPLAGLFAAPTIERLARRFETNAADEHAVGANALRGSGSGTPLFHMPGLGGFGFLPAAMARQIGKDRRFFDGLQHRGVDGRQKPLDRVETIAANLIAQIREVCPSGPYSLTGYCYGGVVAYEVARQLTAAGEKVKGVVMWDSFPARCWRWRSPTGILRALRRRLAGSTPAERFTFFRKQAGRLRGTSKRMAKRALGRRDLPGPAAREGLSPGIRETIIADYRALGAYKPRPYAGPVLLLRTKENERERIAHERLPLNGWDTLLLGRADVVDFPCEHLEILQEPVASEAAGRMAAFLREADES